MTKKTIRNQIASGLIAGGLLGAFIFGDSSCDSRSDITHYLVRDQLVEARLSETIGYIYSSATAVSLTVTALGVGLYSFSGSFRDQEKRKRKQNKREVDNGRK